MPAGTDALKGICDFLPLNTIYAFPRPEVFIIFINRSLYDFDLMCGGGHIKGTYIENSEEVKNAFYSLSDAYR